MAPNPPTPAQLDKFHSIYQDATKIFGDEHTVISPSFFVATDIGGRLSATNKRQAGVSGMLMIPVFGAGGNHWADWWPVVTSADETKIYQTFLDQLNQYQEAQTNGQALPANLASVANTNWDLQRLKVAAQLFCEEDLDRDLLPGMKAKIDLLCKNAQNLTSNSLVDPTPAPPPAQPTAAAASTTATSSSPSALPAADAQSIVDAIKKANPSTLVPRRHNFLIGPALGIPITQNPTDIFQFGAAAEVGGDAFRIMATGGLVGRYQGGTLRDTFDAGWFLGLALSGEIGDELFHYFNGGSNLLAQLAQVKSTTP